jgi:hypothetical protein
MGTTVGDPVLELDYPLAFVQAMSRNFGARSKPFSYVHLGGKYISQNQTDPLWFMQAGRRVKVRISPSPLLPHDRTTTCCCTALSLTFRTHVAQTDF